MKIFSLLLAMAATSGLLAEPDSLDQSFISFLSGTQAPAFLNDSEVWKTQLLQYLKSSEGKQKAENIPLLRLSPNVPVSIRERLLRIEELYRKYRTENPTSKWFRETQIPKAIDEAVAEIEKHRSHLPPEVCAPISEAGDVKRIFIRAENPPLSESPPVAPAKDSTPSRALNVSASRPETWSPQSAATLAEDLVRLVQYDRNPRVISREESGLAIAKAGINKWEAPKDKVLALTEIVFHHSVGNENTSSIVAIQNTHQNSNGWSDIGYHFAIDKDGRIYQGRSLKYQGAHAGTDAGNLDTIGVVFIGNHHPFDPVTNPSGYTDERAGTPTPAAVKAAVSLVLALQNSESDLYQSTASISAIRLDIKSVVGHRHHKATSCPGEACLPLVEALNSISKGLRK